MSTESDIFHKGSVEDHVNVDVHDDIDEPSAKRPRYGAENLAERQRREIGLMRQSDTPNAASFVGSSSGIYFVRSVYSALAQPDEPRLPPPQTPDQNVVPGEDDQLGGAIPFGSNSLWNQREITAETSVLFTFEDLKAWAESYFAYWHLAYPFLKAPVILEFLEELADNASSNSLPQRSTLQMVIVKSIMSISLADRRQSSQTALNPVPACLVFHSFEEAVESIQTTLLIPTSIEALQAAVSVQLFLVSMLRLNGASRLGGLIVRMAFQMGLHRCPDRYPNFRSEEAELRKRLFWSIYCIDRHLCQSLGLPLTIRDDDVDVCHFDKEVHSCDDGQNPSMDERLCMLNFLTKNASIKGNIVELRNKSIHQRRTDKNQAVLISAQIDKWTNEFQYYLDSIDEDEHTQLSQLHRIILLVLRHESVISLNRPLLATSKHSSEYIAALQICIHASRSIISSLYKYLKSRAHGGTHAGLLWPSFTWCIWMSAFILLHAAIEDEIPKNIAKRLADQSVEILRHLAQRGNVWPNVCAVAIEDLFSRLLQGPSTVGLRAEYAATNDVSRETEQIPGFSTHSSVPNRLDGHIFDAIHVPQENFNSPTRGGITGVPASGPGNADLPDTGRTQVQSSTENVLFDHAWNISVPSEMTLDLNPSIPWLNGPDATAATSTDIFESFDIPFWMGDDQYSTLLGSEH